MNSYYLTYSPWSALTPDLREKIVWHKTHIFTKEQLLESLTETEDHIFLPKSVSQFKIVWENNKPPESQDWTFLPYDLLVRAQFRISRQVGGTGRIAILSLLNCRKSELA